MSGVYYAGTGRLPWTVLAAALVLYFTKLGPYPLLGMVAAVYLLLYLAF